MEESKHVCKFCRKSFPCGRSLGGHMRSHVSGNNSAATEDSLAAAASSATGYGLREKRNKTWRVADSSDGTEASNKLCKQCGKGFHSWKALFGHMKCHSDKESRASVTDNNHHHHNNNSLEDQDSWTVTDSQSDNEAPSRPRTRTRTRSKRTRTTTSSLSFSNLSSSVSEIEQEQQEVALSLMMLSRGVSSRGSPEVGSLQKKSKGSEILSPDDQFPRSGFKKSKTKKLDFQSAMEDSDEEDDKEQGKRNFKFLGSELNSNPSKSVHRRGGKFECTTCNKIFHSYQALGGHRASHKKITRDCFVPIDETSENSIKPDLSHHEAISGSDLHVCSICLESFPSEQALDGHKRSHSAEESESRKAESTDLIEEPVEKIRDLIDLNLPPDDADAAEEEDGNNNSNSESYRSSTWWVRSIHNKQEVLVGLLSN